MTNQKLSMAVHMNQTLTAKAMVIKKLMGGNGDESQRFIATLCRHSELTQSFWNVLRIA